MPKMIFVNLPVEDLDRSIAFYKAIGAEQNLQFSNDAAAMMVFSETIHVMLLTHDFFRTFTSKQIADAHQTSEVLLCISCEGRAGVDEITEHALAAGGREPREAQDMGFMYSRTFEDLDGHIWEPMYMDVAAAAQAMGADAQPA
jgi:hypothetical protein